jgi:hypothetical protein
MRKESVISGISCYTGATSYLSLLQILEFLGAFKFVCNVLARRSYNFPVFLYDVVLYFITDCRNCPRCFRLSGNRTSVYAFLKGLVSAVKSLVKITPRLF